MDEVHFLMVSKCHGGGVMWESIGITLVNSAKKMNNALQKLTVETVVE